MEILAQPKAGWNKPQRWKPFETKSETNFSRAFVGGEGRDAWNPGFCQNRVRRDNNKSKQAPAARGIITAGADTGAVLEVVWLRTVSANELLPMTPRTAREPTEHKFFLKDVCIGCSPNCFTLAARP